MRKILNVAYVQFLLGAVLSIYLTSVLVWSLDWHTWLDSPIRENSLWAMIVVYLSVFFSIHNFATHLGGLSFRYVIPVFLFWELIVFACLLVFRLDCSVYYLVCSSSVMLFLFLSFDYLNAITNNKTIAYIQVGRLESLSNLPHITWVKLEEPINPECANADIIMADLHTDLSDEWEHFLAECTLQHIPVYHSSRLLEMVTGRVKIDHMYENELGSLLPSKSYQVVKRLLDTALIILSSPLVLPVMIITGLLISLESRGGMFFIQERIGQGGVPFKMYKFRSMYTGTATDKTTGDSDSRITKVGKFIRKTRIDELPQFYNVLRGEMSLIGPRAEFHKFAEEYEKEIPFYNYRHIVKPGISGWAQVMQGYNFGVDETRIKQEYDFYYIKNFSFSLDLLIFFKTIQTMMTGFGAK